MALENYLRLELLHIRGLSNTHDTYQIPNFSKRCGTAPSEQEMWKVCLWKWRRNQKDDVLYLKSMLADQQSRGGRHVKCNCNVVYVVRCIKSLATGMIGQQLFFGCQLDEPYGFPGDQQQNAAMFQCYVHFFYLQSVFWSCKIVVFCRKQNVLLPPLQLIRDNIKETIKGPVTRNFPVSTSNVEILSMS